MLFTTIEGTPGAICLFRSTWDDYGFKTTFEAVYYENGARYSIGYVKIADSRFDDGGTDLPQTFEELPPYMFSLGTEQYYTFLREKYKEKREEGSEIFKALHDIAYDISLYEKYRDLRVVNYSLLRGFSSTYLKSTLQPLAQWADPSKYIIYRDKNNNIEMTFKVSPGSKPSSNVHVLIGENGCGKTYCMQNMFKHFLLGDQSVVELKKVDDYKSALYFTFSAFDDIERLIFNYDSKKTKRTGKIRGLKKKAQGDGNETQGIIINKPEKELKHDLEKAIVEICSKKRLHLWTDILRALDEQRVFNSYKIEKESFVDMQAEYNYQAIEEKPEEFIKNSGDFFIKLSSGQKIVLVTLAQLLAFVEPDTLVFMDEPELYLHPPLIATYLEQIKKILEKMNGAAIMATHSPVIIQEIPQNCIYRISRDSNGVHVKRPGIQTYGENLGKITTEIFRHELYKCGYYRKMEEEAQKKPLRNFDEIMATFTETAGVEKIGLEAQNLLSMFIYEERQKENEKNQ